jgi:plasmid stabilization system protein ParE
MSRKWSPAADRARDKLFDQLMFSGLPAAERWQLIDDFAHALAEQQRSWAEDSLEFGDPEGVTPEMLPGVRMAADWIDPNPPERPVSSEEKTG